MRNIRRFKELTDEVTIMNVPYVFNLQQLSYVPSDKTVTSVKIRKVSPTEGVITEEKERPPFTYNALFALSDTSDSPTVNLKLCDNLANIASYQVEGYDEVQNPTSKIFVAEKANAVEVDDEQVFRVKFVYNDLTTAENLFNGCSDLKYIDVNDILGENNNITSVKAIFNGCNNLVNVDNMNITDKCTNIASAFTSCKKLTTVQNIENWDTSKVTDMSYTFAATDSITDILANKLTEWDTSSVINMNYIFANSWTQTIKTINVSKWDVSKVKLMEGLIANCPGLVNMDMSNWNTVSVINIAGFALRCRSAGSNVKMFKNFESIETAPQAFSDAYSFMSKAEVEAMHMPKVSNLDFIFGYTNAYTELDLSGWGITSNCVKVRFMFENNLRKLDISGWDLTRAATFKNSPTDPELWNVRMFYRNSDTSQMLTNLEYIIMEGCNQQTLDFVYSVKPENTKIYLDKAKTQEFTK